VDSWTLASSAPRSPEKTLSLDPILVPCAPKSAKLFDGTVDEWHAKQRETARAEGYAAAVQDAAFRLDAVATQLDADRAKALDELPAFALRFAQEVARHLLRTTIQSGGHDIEGMIRDALSRSGVGRGACVVHVSQDDFQLLEGIVFRKGTKVQSDPSLPSGAVHVSTPQGLLVRDIDDCVRAAAEQIYKTMPGHKTPLPVVKPIPPAVPKISDLLPIEEPSIDNQPGTDLASPVPVAPDVDEETLLNMATDGLGVHPGQEHTMHEDNSDA
jgi:hypothetical protein